MYLLIFFLTVLFEPMMDGPARRPIEQLLEVFENRCNASRMQRHEYQTRPRLHKICCRILWFSDVWTGGRHLIGPWKSFLAFPSTRVTVSLELAQRWGSMSRIAGELSYHTCNTRVYVYTYYFWFFFKYFFGNRVNLNVCVERLNRRKNFNMS